MIGTAVCELLAAQDHSHIGFDVKNGGDILNAKATRDASSGCDAIVHCAAQLGLPDQNPEDIMGTNLQGTWNVLQAAVAHNINRVVFLSSVDVLGVFKGERAPDFLPLDGSHPCYPTTPYAISKYLAEQMCEAVSTAQDISVVCLRPPGAWNAGTYQWITSQRLKRAEFEWDPFWEYGAFIDVEDLARACSAALAPSVSGFHALLVSANDITTSGETSYELCRRIHPDVPWLGGREYDDEPFTTLLRNDDAKKVLNWDPAHTWREFYERI